MDNEYEKIPRNILRCPFCGASILTKATDRACYKCNAQMIFEGKEKMK